MKMESKTTIQQDVLHGVLTHNDHTVGLMLHALTQGSRADLGIFSNIHNEE